MPQDRTTPADIRAELPEVAGKVHPLAPGQFARSLAGSLGPSLDEIRQIGTDLGLRPYRVFLVHWQWAGEKGVGRPREISRREILPTPRVRDMSQASFLMSQFGMTEAGGIFIDRISTKYSEDDLRGRTPDLRNPARQQTNLANVEFFWEVREDRQTVPPPKPRRFTPGAVPMLSRSAMSWSLPLTKQSTSYEVEPEVPS